MGHELLGHLHRWRSYNFRQLFGCKRCHYLTIPRRLGSEGLCKGYHFVWHHIPVNPHLNLNNWNIILSLQKEPIINYNTFENIQEVVCGLKISGMGEGSARNYVKFYHSRLVVIVLPSKLINIKIARIFININQIFKKSVMSNYSKLLIIRKIWWHTNRILIITPL